MNDIPPEVQSAQYLRREIEIRTRAPCVEARRYANRLRAQRRSCQNGDESGGGLIWMPHKIFIEGAFFIVLLS